MRYCRFQTSDGPQYGEVVERGGELWIDRLLPPFEEDPWTRAAGGRFEPLPFEKAQLLAPVVPRKVVCIGRNYREHAAELGNEVPKEPLLFLKASSAVIGPGEAIRIPAQSQRVDFEGELAVVIGRRATKLGADEDIRPYVRGFTIVNDVTARDLQKSDGQWSRAKGFDTFCPMGPLVTDEIDPAAGLTVETRLNGEVKQHGTTKDLIFDIAALLRHITAAMTLLPGDVIPTGTPAGVAPMKTGDRVEVIVEGIGTLGNPIL
ncbi:MAG TPA: fumarylacetoacetate hydrolase family protein [Acidobacteriaceae bacterium]|jgi:2-keto-4-pentenoate hydratase/2-oxohepta-3-ene-1,7-dioic acid hydratase in catechol pathway|nr:fumarylacetoacetate hydrolase family protein [Acidobacteriaceae bacterium]